MFNDWALYGYKKGDNLGDFLGEAATKEALQPAADKATQEGYIKLQYVHADGSKPDFVKAINPPSEWGKNSTHAKLQASIKTLLNAGKEITVMKWEGVTTYWVTYRILELTDHKELYLHDGNTHSLDSHHQVFFKLHDQDIQKAGGFVAYVLEHFETLTRQHDAGDGKPWGYRFTDPALELLRININ